MRKVMVKVKELRRGIKGNFMFLYSETVVVCADLGRRLWLSVFCGLILIFGNHLSPTLIILNRK